MNILKKHKIRIQHRREQGIPDTSESNQIKVETARPSEALEDLASFLKEATEEPEVAAKKGPDPQASEMFTCTECGQQMLIREMRKVLYVCPKCGKHHKISARRRVRNLVDPGTFRKLKCNVGDINPLDYPDYNEKIAALREKTGMDEGVLAGIGEIEGEKASDLMNKKHHRLIKKIGIIKGK